MHKLPLCMLLGLLCCSCTNTIRVTPDSRGFAFAASGKPFTPWGFNYGGSLNDFEDGWYAHLPDIARDFVYMQSLGANVLRLHLTFGMFMDGPEKPNEKALDQLVQLVRLAERSHLYLDLTGLACYHKALVPPWYDGLSEHDRWAAQACFWGAIARCCANSPAIFCYDLMNEPRVGKGRKPGQWYSNFEFGGYDFMQYISLDLAGRSQAQVVDQWIGTLSKAIHQYDARHLITVGVNPWTRQWGFWSGFDPAKYAADVDFIAMHIYPKGNKPDEALQSLGKFVVGKPIVIEETFPLNCGIDVERKFLLNTRGIAAGWVGFCGGETIEELQNRAQKNHEPGPAIWSRWLELFRELTPQMTQPPGGQPH